VLPLARPGSADFLGQGWAASVGGLVLSRAWTSSWTARRFGARSESFVVGGSGGCGQADSEAGSEAGGVPGAGKYRRERVERDRRLERLAVEVLTALGKTRRDDRRERATRRCCPSSRVPFDGPAHHSYGYTIWISRFAASVLKRVTSRMTARPAAAGMIPA
jgi:hypothetical protein